MTDTPTRKEVTIFTMGFKGKSAEEFFTMLNRYYSPSIADECHRFLSMCQRGKLIA